jgi:hypothetical protein
MTTLTLLIVSLIFLIEVKNMADFSKLNASVAKLSSDVDTFLSKAAAASAAEQPTIDAAQAAVDAADAKVVAATPA